MLCIFDVLFIVLYIWVYAIRLGKETAPILMLKRSDNPFWRYSRNYTVSAASMCCTTSYPYFFIFWTLITSWCRLFTVVIHGTVIGRYVYLTIYIIREDDGYNIYVYVENRSSHDTIDVVSHRPGPNSTGHSLICTSWIVGRGLSYQNSAIFTLLNFWY